MAPNSQNIPNRHSKKFKIKTKVKSLNFKTPYRVVHRSRSRKRSKDAKFRERKDKSKSRKQSRDRNNIINNKNPRGNYKDFEEEAMRSNNIPCTSNNKYENVVSHYLSKLKDLFSKSSMTSVNSSDKSVPRTHSCTFQSKLAPNAIVRQRAQMHSDESLMVPPPAQRRMRRSPSPYPNRKSSMRVLNKERDVKQKAYKVLKAALAYGFANDLLEKRGDFFALKKMKSKVKRRSPTPAPRTSRHNKYFETRPMRRESNDYLNNSGFNNINYDSKSIHEIQKYSKKEADRNSSSTSFEGKMYNNECNDFCYYCNRYNNNCNCNSLPKS